MRLKRPIETAEYPTRNFEFRRKESFRSIIIKIEMIKILTSVFDIRYSIFNNYFEEALLHVLLKKQ
jgi:hypothetical protein